MKNEKEFVDLEMEFENADHNRPESKADTDLFFGIIANMIYRKLPEDYWEKEGIGWK